MAPPNQNKSKKKKGTTTTRKQKASTKKTVVAKVSNIENHQNIIRTGDNSYFPVRFPSQLLNLVKGFPVKGLPPTVTARSLESTHGEGTYLITNPNDWGKNFNMGSLTSERSPAAELLKRLCPMSFRILCMSDGFFEKDTKKRNEILSRSDCRIYIQHVPQWSDLLGRYVHVFDRMSKEDLLHIRSDNHLNHQPAYNNKHKIKYRVTEKRKGKKDKITVCDSAIKVSKEVNGGNVHKGLRTYLQPNVYQEFVDSLGDSSRSAKGILWPIGNPNDYVNKDGTLKKDLPKKMNNNYYKIECFISNA